MKPEWIGRMIVRELRGLERELDAYPDERDIWQAVPGLPNTAGTLALHLCGNLRHFVGAELGDTGYVRNRDAEFARRDVSRADLVAEIGATIEAVERTLGAGRSIDWAARYPHLVGSGYSVDTGDWMVHLVSHLGYHLGQIDYHRRMVTGENQSVDLMAISGLATARKEEKR
jgi:hypothetical protein